VGVALKRATPPAFMFFRKVFVIDEKRLVTLVGEAGRLVGLKELMKVIGLHPGQQTALKRVLRGLVKQGALEQDGKRFGVPAAKVRAKSGPAWVNKAADRWGRKGGEQRGRAPKSRGPTVEGTISHHRDGFAFVRLAGGQKVDDVFVPAGEAAKALDGDRVVLSVERGRDGRSAGRIVEVRQRTRQMVVGEYHESEGEAWVTPREAQLGRIEVPVTQLARPGDVVKVRLGVGEKVLKAHQALVGEVAGSLGATDDHSVEVLTLAFGKGFHDEFPPEVMDEADTFPVEVTDDLWRGEKRVDLRKLPLVTIDGEDARDFDDAIFVERHGEGYRLVVAIADVANYVTPGSALDAEGLRRATSVYLPGRVLPMLPERLSNGLCSLKPNEDRLCMVADMVISKDARPVGAEIYQAVMRSAARCTYTEVHRVLGGEHVPGRMPFAEQFRLMHELAQKLTAMRLARGAIDFDLPETRVELDAHGLPAKMVRRERWESHRLVEECMLAANEAVARFFSEKGLTTVNRYHGEPDEKKLGTFLQLLGAYGFEVPKSPLTSKAFNSLLASLHGHPEQRALHQLALRSMMQAVYSSQETGHYGLGATDYLHFTSPIRRYPDLLVHRLLKQLWNKKGGKKARHSDAELEAMAQQSSDRERAAMLVEREVTALYACLLMKDRVGEEFAATVSGLTEAGFFVELDDIYVEGLAKGETVFPRFRLDLDKHALVFGDGRVVRVGQKLRVALTSVNLKRRQIDFEPLEFAETRTERAPARGKKTPAPDAFRPSKVVRSEALRDRVRSEEKPRRGKAPQRSAPPPREAVRAEPGPSASFDPRAVLDRLWRERGAKKGSSDGQSRAKPASKGKVDRRGR
jgi:ribonuclease R